jgi:hypothetical protein
MTSRATEELLLKRCLTVAQTGSDALSPDEANLFRLVAQLVRTNYPAESAVLEQSHARYFSGHPEVAGLSFLTMLDTGLVTDLPRLRSVLEHQLANASAGEDVAFDEQRSDP